MTVKEKAELEFEEWWESIGSEMLPRRDDETEFHAKKIAQQAWKDAITSFIYQHD